MGDLRWTIIRIGLGQAYKVESGEAKAEVERYIYGPYLHLDDEPSDIRPDLRFAFYLVEEFYAQAIIDRLASGLIPARRATVGEVNARLYQPSVGVT